MAKLKRKSTSKRTSKKTPVTQKKDKVYDMIETVEKVEEVKSQVEETKPVEIDDPFAELIESDFDFSTSDILKITGKYPDRDYRFISAKEVTSKRATQGWIPVNNPESMGVPANNDLVLCHRPKTLGDQHREALRKKAKRVIGEMSKDQESDLQSLGLSTMGKMEISRGSVKMVAGL